MPGATFCIAVDGAAGSSASTDPTGGAGAWSYADIDGTNHLFAVSCATATTFCVATDDHGNVITTHEPTAGTSAWTVEEVDPGRWLIAVSCPVKKLCIRHR